MGEMSRRYLIMDFETYSEAPLKSVGAYEYSKHKSTEVICCAFALGTEEDFKLGTYDLDAFAPFLGWNLKAQERFERLLADESIILVAHNVFFDANILRNVLLRKIKNAPDLPYLGWDRWQCTMARVSALALPKALEHLGSALHLKIKKDMKGNRLVKKWCKPRLEPKEGQMMSWLDEARIGNVKALDELQQIVDYCKKDIKVTAALIPRLRPLIPSEQELWELTQTINMRGFAIDRMLVSAILNLIKGEVKRLDYEMVQLSGGKVESSTQLVPFRQLVSELGYELENVQKETIAEALKDPDIPGKVRTALINRAERSKSSTAKFSAFDLVSRGDGRARGGLVYHAAITGRWQGALFNALNLPRGTLKDTNQAAEIILEGLPDVIRLIYGSLMDVFSDCIRAVIVPGPGMIFDSADYSQIEARVLNWMAGNHKALAIFSDPSRDAYREAAQEIFGAPAASYAKDSFERFTGKEQTLGCGFGMGWKRFKDRMSEKGYEISDELAQRIINLYRNNNPAIPHMWRSLEHAAIQATLRPGREFSACKTVWKREGEFLFCRLPSGRELAYHEPEVKIEHKYGRPQHTLHYWMIHPKTKKRIFSGSYGGKLTENCFTGDTLVLTSRGWQPLSSVTLQDMLFDGVEWVVHSGLIDQGLQEVILWQGVRLTGDHLILAGRKWKRAIALDENASAEALELGRALVPWWLRNQKLAKMGLLFAGVPAGKCIPYQLGRCIGQKIQAVLSVLTKRAALPGVESVVTLPSLRTLSYALSGPIATQGWSHAAPILPPIPILTMAAEGSRYLKSGWKIRPAFFGMQKHLKDGMTLVWRWTGSTTMGLMRRAIFDWYPGERTVETVVNRFTSPITEGAITCWSFIRSFVLSGHPAPCDIISKQADRQMTSSPAIERVYDLVNCGPRFRFVVMTSKGPVIAHNCVQATARDIMAHAKTQLEKSGVWKVVLSVHDEIISERPLDSTVTNDDYVRVLETVPAWAKGCPVKAEGWAGMRYKK